MILISTGQNTESHTFLHLEHSTHQRPATRVPLLLFRPRTRIVPLFGAQIHCFAAIVLCGQFAFIAIPPNMYSSIFSNGGNTVPSISHLSRPHLCQARKLSYARNGTLHCVEERQVSVSSPVPFSTPSEMTMQFACYASFVVSNKQHFHVFWPYPWIGMEPNAIRYGIKSKILKTTFPRVNGVALMWIRRIGKQPFIELQNSSSARTRYQYPSTTFLDGIQVESRLHYPLTNRSWVVERQPS